MRDEPEEHEGLFIWDGPPTSEALAELLNQATGRSLRDVGDLYVPIPS